MSSGDISVSELHSMEPYEFEYFIADLWRRRGYDAEVSQQSADGGVDIVATDGNERIAIQAKRYADGNPVGVKTVREMAGVSNRARFDRAAIATTGEFTRDAYKEANQQDVKLYTGGTLVDMNRSADGSSAGRPSTLRSIIGLLVSLDPDDIVNAFVNLIYIIIFIAVGYTILDAILTNMFDFPLPGGI